MASGKIKIKFNFDGVDYAITTHPPALGGDIYINGSEAGQMVKQYAKQMFPDVLIKVHTDKDRWCDALTVHVTNLDGSAVTPDVLKEIDEFADRWLESSRIYGGVKHIAVDSNGKKVVLRQYATHVFVFDTPKFGTPEWVNQEILTGNTLGDVLLYVKPDVVERYKKLFVVGA